MDRTAFNVHFPFFVAKLDKIMISCSFLSEKLQKVVIKVSVFSYWWIKYAV